MPAVLSPIGSIRPTPIDAGGLRERVRLTLAAALEGLLAVVALPLAILSVLVFPLLLVGVGFLLALGVVPATEWVTGLQRRLAGGLLGEPVPASYDVAARRGWFARLTTWLRDPVRWRDFAGLWFAATGGFVLSVIPVGLLTAPVVHLVFTLVDGGFWWLILFLVSFPMLVVWWLVTPALVRARARAERAILGGTRVARLERRVREVSASRRETLDHSAAEVRRIERDLHDGAQARIASVGMNVGLAEKLLATDPEAAAALLREARESTVSALEDLRSVVRGIHPPALADRGLAGGIEALTVPIPVPVTVTVDTPPLPPPVESAAYFAVAECLANTVKHAGATRGWVRVRHDGELLHVVVGDDGRGGADPFGSGLAGVARRLAAFDGTMVVDSPPGGPTVVTMEVPCRTSASRA